MFPLTSGQNTIVTASGVDASLNAAPITVDSFTVDDHAKAYAILQNPHNILVVSRGPLGNFRLTVTSKSAAGVTLTSTQDFTVSVGDAVQTVLSVAPASSNVIGIPPVPAGW